MKIKRRERDERTKTRDGHVTKTLAKRLMVMLLAVAVVVGTASVFP